MSSKEIVGANSRQCSIESGLTQIIGPVLVCIPEKKLKEGSDQLPVPSTAASKMAKMKKKMHSPLSKRKSGSNQALEESSSTNKVFGVSLEESCKSLEGSPVPWAVTRIVDYLTKCGLRNEGIFRVSGNKKSVDMMKAAFDRDNDADLEEIGDVMGVAGLLKQYLRELPEPPIPQNLTQEFIRIHEVYGDDNAECLDELQALLDRLPYLNYQLVKYLCHFLVRVSKEEEYNKMNTMALAIVFGPNLFRCNDGLEGLKEQGHTNAILCKFLEDYDNLFKDDDEVSPYATTDLFITDRGSSDSLNTGPSISDKAIQEGSTSEEEVPVPSTSTSDTTSQHEPIYASIDKTKKHLLPTSVSSSSEELDLYVRSVSPSMWHSNTSTNGNNSHNGSHTHHQHQEQPGRDVVQMVIKDSIKEHLFGPDTVSTDENECSATDSEISRGQSAESLDDVTAPPLPARHYGEEETSKPQPKRRKNVKKQKNLQDTVCDIPDNPGRPLPVLTDSDQSSSTSNKKRSQLTVNLEAMDQKELVISLDQNSNSILQVRPKSNTAISGNATGQDHIVPKQDELSDLPKNFIHPLVEEAKNRGKIATPPPRSPRSPKVSKSPPSPSSPNKHGTIDEVDGGYNPVKELTKQYKKRSRGAPVVPPLELYKLQQGDVGGGSDNLIKYDVQLSPRERYDGVGSDEALLSPRSRPLTIDTKSSYPTECPPSPPHDHVEPFWSERRLDISPKGDLSVKQISRNIHQLKKKIREFEEGFEAEYGRRPSQTEKAPIKKHLGDLTCYRKQLKELKEKAKEESERLNDTAPPFKQEPITSTEPLLTTTPASVQQSLDNILRKLQDKRKSAGRNEDLQSLTMEQLQDEKLSVQKALLQHESVFGRPTSKKDKDIMRPLYDRYRMIKRKLNISRTQNTKEDQSKSGDERSDQDTVTEQEDFGSEEQLFATPTLLRKSLLSSPVSKASPKKWSDNKIGVGDDLDDGDDFGGSQDNLDDNKERDTKLHQMSHEELQRQVELAKREKKMLRKKLKKFEDDFLERTGRRVQKDERGEMEDYYREYKQIKARLRLIDVLLNKRQSSLTI
uniref:Protein FAM13A-like isoform X3 n=1 Tax=Actinia tenebrosa TaxID=6105 RepID=A0A6P8IJE2_ACTTE